MAASEHSSSQNLDLADCPVWRNLIGRSGSIAATEPRELSGRSETTSGQPDQLPLRPRANDRIGLRAAAQIVKANGSDRPNPVIGTREHRMTAPDHSADVRSMRTFARQANDHSHLGKPPSPPRPMPTRALPLLEMQGVTMNKARFG